MVRWLVLGGGGASQTVLGVLSTWPGELEAIMDERRRARTLRDGTVDVTVGDPGDPAGYPAAADVVLVTVPPDDVARVTERARGAFPGARLVAVLDTAAEETVRRRVATLADRTVDASALLSEAVLGAATGPAADRLRGLRRALRAAAAPFAVVTHDNPDPDAIGSALALVRIASGVGLDARAYYSGEISHQENRALVNLLDVDLVRLADADPASFGGVALVDHSRAGVNDGLSAETDVDVVIDHHPPREPVEARFVDLRRDAGATSTLLAEYLDGYGIEPDRTVATALLYGIRIDTDDFTREVAAADFEAAAFLLEHVDATALSRIEAPSVGPEVFDTFAAAIRNREVHEGALITGVGPIGDRDALAQAADRLVRMEGVEVAVVHGFTDGVIYVSGRASGATIDLGETLRDAFGAIGSAGGHANMAGAQLPLGILADTDAGADRDALAEVVADLLARRFFETLETPRRPVEDGHDLGQALPFEPDAGGEEERESDD